MNDLGRFVLIWLAALSLLAFALFAQDTAPDRAEAQGPKWMRR